MMNRRAKEHLLSHTTKLCTGDILLYRIVVDEKKSNSENCTYH